MDLLHGSTLLIHTFYRTSTTVASRDNAVKSLYRLCIVWAVSVGGGHRIGEFARRVGVTPELLRAWESRYGLLHPVRSPGGFRLYTDEDADRVARMQRALGDGFSAAEAAQVALAQDPPAPSALGDARVRLLDAVKGYDESALQAVLDDAVGAFGLE